jgi:hypothetical protein
MKTRGLGQSLNSLLYQGLQTQNSLGLKSLWKTLKDLLKDSLKELDWALEGLAKIVNLGQLEQQ